ncbi:MAG: glycosyltransferase family 4 protein [Anaerolineae bacterium]|jgi:glycosyltransferase involved in cell wall biosynthesis|nr:glycosyltransferase family 4 protein [Anaerolineae bacterium]MDH7472989.1 glycosyltransferase family 1 protein [Anaerolineae bacterium]
MLIGIDASRAARARRTGTENYALHLIRGLLTLDRSHHYRLYFNRRPPPGLFVPGPNWEPRVIPFPRLWTHVRLSWEMAWRPPDVLFVPAHVLPVIHPRRSLVTVHDLGYRYYPTAHRPLDRLYLDLSTRYHTRAASHILADSQATRNDLVREYGADPTRITVVYPGVDESLGRVDDPVAIAAVRGKYGIHGTYVLYVGTLHPRKNLVRLIEAFSILESDVELVIAGQKGWLYDSIFARVRELGLEQRVVFPGYVADVDLPALLSGARVFVFPSLYEGFGFPVLEAMACGVPVVCSNASSLPEVAGDAALLVDPLDVKAWGVALERALTDEELRSELISRGYAQVRRFSWTRAAGETLRAIVGQA